MEATRLTSNDLPLDSGSELLEERNSHEQVFLVATSDMYQQQEQPASIHSHEDLMDDVLRERMKQYVEQNEGSSERPLSEDDHFDHHDEEELAIASPMRRKHLTATMMSPLGIKKNHQKVFLEMFHHTLPESIHTVEETEKKESMAATILQKAVKGFIVRRRYMKRRMEEAKNKAEYEANKSELSNLKKKSQSQAMSTHEMQEQSLKLKKSIQASINRIKSREQARQESATIIQRAWRRKKEQNPSRLDIQEPSEKLLSALENSEYFGSRISIEDLMVLLTTTTTTKNTVVTRPDYSYRMTLI
ncbi:hypothetical protein C9374_000776 [Naegleria lovaniensis]|uniref:Uncharacterized protein n=1 Tax=Naegleria lovaniensis TaxID=51637 RepID=A0AA88KNS4_NAELO|nr:uncharacterized protein C9374_000776 [Naegleria lovaniensis]KAG2387926.1 hypothetical protein C9374_000776 [Naegleria lovaniensis]